MICRNCGTEIADKALICYRCGTATSEPRIAPPPKPTARSRPVVPLVVAIVALVLVVWNVVRTPLDQLQVWPLAVITLAAVALIVRWLRRRP